MATYTFLKNDSMQTTPVSNVFIDQYLPVANATFVKVYLYGLRQCFAQNNVVENKEIAKALNILETDVLNAWLYWESVGVVRLNRRSKDSTPTEFGVEFIDLTHQKPSEDMNKPRVTLQNRPNYTPEEISIYIEQNDSIRFMYKYYEEKSGKALSSADINTLYSFYDWLRLPVEVIVMLLEYCHSIGKMNIRYIEKVAIGWADEGINSIDKAEKHLKKIEARNSALYQVRKKLGLMDRALSDTEVSYIDKWTQEMKHDVELIKLAFDVTVMNTGKLSFPYMNSILESWHQRGINTLTQAQADIKNHKQNNKSKYEKNIAKTLGKGKNNKFVNFTQRDYDFKELERLAQQKNLNKLKESRSSNGL